MRKGLSLYDYLTYNLYPPIREEIKTSILEYFTKYWNREIDYKTLVEKSHWDEDKFIDEFSFWLLPEDVNGDVLSEEVETIIERLFIHKRHCDIEDCPICELMNEADNDFRREG
jgi:nuclear transport factor 2 (NTF2) superfamily protein